MQGSSVCVYKGTAMADFVTENYAGADVVLSEGDPFLDLAAGSCDVVVSSLSARSVSTICGTGSGVSLRLHLHLRTNSGATPMLVDKGAQKPECGDLSGVIKQNSGDEVHALHVPDRLVIVGERDQHALESLARLSPLKELDLNEGALKVLIYVL